MDDQKIKSAMKSQLDSLEMDKQLKEKTMSYIMNQHLRTKSQLKFTWISSRVGFIAICLMVFILIHKGESANYSLAPSSTLGEEVNVQTRQLQSSLDTLQRVMDQLGLTYTVGTSQVEASYTITPIIIEGNKNYYVELSTNVDNFDVCSQTSLQVIQLDEKSLFLSVDADDELIKSLITDYTILCK